MSFRRSTTLLAARLAAATTARRPFYFPTPFYFRRAVAFAASGLTTAALVAPCVMCLSSNKKAPPFDYEAIRKELVELIEDDYARGPLFLRLAWHAAGSWDCKAKNGGSNTASMRFKPEGDYDANNGLDQARDLLEGIKKKHPKISYADLWVLAGLTAIAVMNGPEIPFRWGRKDATDNKNCSPPGRLPDASQTQDHVRCVFSRMGFNEEDTVALIGAHAVGRTHRQHSGYEGFWTNDPYGFGNQFFTTLLENDWVVNKNEPVLQFNDLETRKLVMLPADVAVILDPKYRKYAEAFAKDQDLWHKKFAAAFARMMEFNTSGLYDLP